MKIVVEYDQHIEEQFELRRKPNLMDIIRLS